MKKKIINGILFVALIFATSSAFVSCKDNDSDVQTELLGKIADLRSQIAALQLKVDGIKSCECDGYSREQIDAKIKALQDAIAALPTKTDLDAYLKIADLPAAVKALLVDYYTKAEVDKLLEAYAKSGDITKALEGYYTKEEVDKLLENIPQGGGGLTEDQVKALIEKALEDYAKKTDLDEYAKKADIPDTYTKAQILSLISAEVAKLEAKIDAIYFTMVTSLNIDAVKNPIFGFVSAPVDIQSNILVACYGKADSDIEFPLNSGNNLAFAGDLLIGPDGNAGKLYVTVNPSSVNFAGKTLALENTAGEASPVKLSALVESNEVLKFGVTRGATGFYEANATINENNLENAYISLPKKDMQELGDDIKALFKNKNIESFKDMAVDLYRLYAKNKLTAYRLKATWGDGYNTFSETKIAALAVKPLSYSFDPEGADAKNNLEKFEQSCFYTEVDIDDDSDSYIGQFLYKFNKGVYKTIDHINWALQPCLLVRKGNTVATMNWHYDGDIKILMTSRSGEIFAPAYKKYLKITPADDIIPVLNQVYDGSVKEVPFKLEPGVKYNVEYQAVDYSGVVRTRTYTMGE